ncbi:MAG TPA: SRPBCC family protein [Gammaproteobacteria bacterium]
MKKRYLLLAFLSAFSTQAAEFENIDVSLENGVYRVHAQARIDAGIQAVRHVITDYNHMHWITGAVLKAEVLERPAPDVAIVFVRSRACFSIFCKTIEQVQRADSRDDDVIVFETLPERGDLKQGRSEWRLQKIGDGQTRLSWDMMMEPDFWVPWLIGPGLIQSGLADEGRDMINGIEKLANEREAR